MLISFKIQISPLLMQIQEPITMGQIKMLSVVGIFFIAILYFTFQKYLRKDNGLKKKKRFFSKRRVTVDLMKERNYRPQKLTFIIRNNGRKSIDLEQPVLVFSRLLEKRKFLLKGVNGYEIYPLYLESGKTHELPISLSVFYEHDKKLKRFYWAKVFVYDTKGRKYSSYHVTLKRSLYS